MQLFFCPFICLAIYHRKHPGLHARYMVSTIFLCLRRSQIGSSIIFKAYIGFGAEVGGYSAGAYSWILLADILLLCLVVWDWSANKRKDAFLTALILVMVYHITTLTLYQFDFWRSFGVWFAGLW
ncbi:MAG: hypothetical protein IPP42_04780 [Saprospiraceae bacterium]|nr:hypothetical protein [Saprospiraceae bacterium]